MSVSSKQGGPAANDPGAQVTQMLVTLFANGQHAEAEKLARWVTEQFPGHALGWKVLGAVLKNAGRTAEALLPMQKAVELNLRDHEAINNLGVTLQELGHVDHAVACFQSAIELNPDYVEAYDQLGWIYQEQQKLDLALQCYRHKLRLTPDDTEVRHLVDSLSGATTDRAPDVYVEKLFDGFAAQYDHRLQNLLDYDAPAQLATEALAHLDRPSGHWRVLDLGCGTGLMGAAIAPHVAHLVGVDLSGKMLEKAQALQLYHRLEKAELVEMMSHESSADYDAVFAAEVLVYFGKLDEVVPQVQRLLSPGGVFIFSTESPTAAADAEGQGTSGQLPDYQLTPSGRYSHSPAYLTALASRHGMAVLSSTDVQLRVEHGQPVKSCLMVWKA